MEPGAEPSSSTYVHTCVRWQEEKSPPARHSDAVPLLKETAEVWLCNTALPPWRWKPECIHNGSSEPKRNVLAHLYSATELKGLFWRNKLFLTSTRHSRFLSRAGTNGGLPLGKIIQGVEARKSALLKRNEIVFCLIWVWVSARKVRRPISRRGCS